MFIFITHKQPMATMSVVTLIWKAKHIFTTVQKSLQMHKNNWNAIRIWYIHKDKLTCVHFCTKNQFLKFAWGLFYYHLSTWFPAWTSNYIDCKVWDENTNLSKPQHCSARYSLMYSMQWPHPNATCYQFLVIYCWHQIDGVALVECENRMHPQ